MSSQKAKESGFVLRIPNKYKKSHLLQINQSVFTLSSVKQTTCHKINQHGSKQTVATEKA